MRLVEDYKEYTKSGGIIKKISTVFLDPCFQSVVLYRLSSLFYKLKLSILAKIVWYINRIVFSVDIDYRANLAGGFVLVHGLGTIIGKDVVSKGKLTVYQGVTIGGSGKSNIIDNREIWQPILEDGVCVYTNAMIIGPCRIGKNVVIKAGERVTCDK